MIQLPLRCWRGRDDCEPLHSIEALPEGQAEMEAAYNAGARMTIHTRDSNVVTSTFEAVKDRDL